MIYWLIKMGSKRELSEGRGQIINGEVELATSVFDVAKKE